jgi:hypothetical protein
MVELFLPVGNVLEILLDVGSHVILGHWNPLRCPHPHQSLPGRGCFHTDIFIVDEPKLVGRSRLSIWTMQNVRKVRRGYLDEPKFIQFY